MGMHQEPTCIVHRDSRAQVHRSTARPLGGFAHRRRIGSLACGHATHHDCIGKRPSHELFGCLGDRFARQGGRVLDMHIGARARSSS